MFDLNKFDKNFDEAYESLNLTLTSRELAIWRLLTVAEDFTRIMYMSIGINDPVVFSIKLDEMKYIYKFSINKIYKDFKSFPSLNLKLSTDKKSYPEYFNFILKTIDYKKAVHLMSMLHTNTFSIQSTTNNNYYIKYKNDYNISYNMLESIGINKPKTDDFISLLVNFYFRQDDNYFVNRISEILYENVFLKKRKIKYNFNKKLFKEIISVAGHRERERLHLEVFHYSWGSSDLTAKLIDALIYRCLYHLISIRVANIKYNFIGGFEDSLVLVTEKNKLINDISLISDIKDIEKIKEFLEFLEFPKNLDKSLSSDAALQPLFLHQKEYFIPCFHIIESNIERNLMTLFARNDSKNFDKQSNIFEKKMINQIEGNLINQIYKKNYKKRINKKDQEFDFLFIDEINKKILIIELRWMIQPADPREVINKRKACYEKVQKVKEKKNFYLKIYLNFL
ncbi:hypothetical protein [Acinetobacter sp. TR11]|uniref:hypothetical protein n=1 Tax=Acinetobacter sp. TR11 TaxID=3003393 RepID=UPI0022AC66B9|nr:hypothetical protein [Acinetobacter sp. TR11]WAU73700.1 hypothetical protein O1450_00725 [Acinetobacter sp. TR11]